MLVAGVRYGKKAHYCHEQESYQLISTIDTHLNFGDWRRAELEAALSRYHVAFDYLQVKYRLSIQEGAARALYTLFEKRRKQLVRHSGRTSSDHSRQKIKGIAIVLCITIAQHFQTWPQYLISISKVAVYECDLAPALAYKSNMATTHILLIEMAITPNVDL